MITLALLALAWPQLQAVGQPPAIPDGYWNAWLESPGGALPFGLELRRPRGVDLNAPGDEVWSAALINGPECIEISEAIWLMDTDGASETWTLELRFPHYDSVIRCQTALEGSMLSGQWVKTSSKDKLTQMSFQARYAGESDPQPLALNRFRPRPYPPGAQAPSLAPRYRVQFESSKDPAVGIFEVSEQQVVHATFLTTTGDYRYLAGNLDAGGLRLSCFDGAHAFLFTAERVPGRQVHGGLATLSGHFYSRDTWHESWHAEPDAKIELPDPWQEVGLKPEAERPDWRRFQATALDGSRVELGKLAQPGQARLLVLFGSWCPNCHDEHRYLKELYAKYAARGLAITSLAFELGGDRKRDLAQLARYQSAMQLPWPIVLVADSTDKKLAAQAFPIVEEVKSYPTTLFIDASGAIRAVHSGFSGPATGAAYERLQRSFEEKVEALFTVAK
jgi:thiol-disulfide isomerase/thioredoxin